MKCQQSKLTIFTTSVRGNVSNHFTRFFMSQTFVVTIPVKPYVKRFIEINFGSPARFTCNPEVNKFFLSLLKKPDTSKDKRYPEQLFNYTAMMEVAISQHDFYHFGWELTRTDIVAFGKHFEEKAKFMMRSFVGVYVAAGMPIFKSINLFQERFLFDDAHWDYQSIKKDFYRNGTNAKIDFGNEIFGKIDEILLRNLYTLGTLSKKAKNEYETPE